MVMKTMTRTVLTEKDKLEVRSAQPCRCRTKEGARAIPSLRKAHNDAAQDRSCSRFVRHHWQLLPPDDTSCQ